MRRAELGVILLTAVLFSALGLFWIHTYVRRLDSLGRPLVLVLSIDAFRHDFIQRPESVTLGKLGRYCE